MIGKTSIPETLRTRAQWICWEERTRNGTKTKVPIDPQRGTVAQVSEERTWSDVETALAYLEANPTSVGGLGFVFTDGDPIVGVDLDDCRDPATGRPTEQAKTIINRLDSYTEISPSGTGYHVLVTGELPGDRNRRGHVEMYEHARYFTVTGNHVSGTPPHLEDRQEALEEIHSAYVREDDDEPSASASTPTSESASVETPSDASTPRLSDDEVLERATNASNGAKFERLWNGSTAGYDSQSEADMALCCLLAFWTGGRVAQMDRLFRRSGLDRSKWSEVHYADGSTYGEKTIARAIDHTTAFYEPSASSSGATKEVDSDPDEGDPRSRDRELLYLKEKYRFSRAQVATLESQLDAKRERIAVLERRLTQVEGKSSTRGEPSGDSRETQSGTGVFEWVRGLLER